MNEAHNTVPGIKITAVVNKNLFLYFSISLSIRLKHIKYSFIVVFSCPPKEKGAILI